MAPFIIDNTGVLRLGLQKLAVAATEGKRIMVYIKNRSSVPDGNSD